MPLRDARVPVVGAIEATSITSTAGASTTSSTAGGSAAGVSATGGSTTVGAGSATGASMIGCANGADGSSQSTKSLSSSRPNGSPGSRRRPARTRRPGAPGRCRGRNGSPLRMRIDVRHLSHESHRSSCASVWTVFAGTGPAWLAAIASGTDTDSRSLSILRAFRPRVTARSARNDQLSRPRRCLPWAVRTPRPA